MSIAGALLLPRSVAALGVLVPLVAAAVAPPCLLLLLLLLLAAASCRPPCLVLLMKKRHNSRRSHLLAGWFGVGHGMFGQSEKLVTPRFSEHTFRMQRFRYGVQGAFKFMSGLLELS